MKRSEVWDCGISNSAKSWLVDAGYQTKEQLANAALADVLVIPGIGNKTLRALSRWACGGRFEREYIKSQKRATHTQQQHIAQQIKFLESKGYEVKKKDNHESAH